MTRSRRCSSQLTAAFVVLATGFTAPHDLHASFGVSGRATTNLAVVATSLVRQPDGKLVAGGFALSGQFFTRLVLVRYDAEGLLDPTFGAGGIVSTAFATDSSAALAVVVQPDGKLVAAGTVTSGAVSDFGVARYDADGTLDPSFGSGGLVTTDFLGGVDQARGLVLQPDGKLVAAGVARPGTSPVVGSFALARYAADGALDPSFGTGGTVTTPFASGDASAASLLLQPDGKLVAAGKSGADFALARYDGAGALDASFGSGGMLTTSFPGATPGSVAASIVLQPDGKLVAGGLAGRGISLGADFALARYDADGTLDATFGTGGLVTTDFDGNYDECTALALQPDGKLVAAGRAFVGTGSEFAEARYDADGTLDPSFGAGGLATTDGGGLYDGALALVLQPDGKLVAGGAIDRPGSAYGLTLLRSNPDGSRDACAGAPEAGCRVSSHSLLMLTQNGPNHVNHLKWQWRQGAMTTLGEFGAPDATTGYQLCLYDQSGARLGVGVLGGGTCNGKSCWRATPTGFTYRDQTLVPDGVFQLQLRAGGDGKARTSVVGKGDKLALPTLPFASFPITVQLKRPDGGPCWEATYATALKNEVGRFAAKE
jgi:uncharacterized delta-60 repeat protein